ncbi:hypothetical protein ACLBUQ_32575, partial [Pseudomonas aeruginosa]
QPAGSLYRSPRQRAGARRQPYRAIAGDWAERRRQAFAAVQGLLRDG